jgi:putative redox protein
MTIRIKRLNDAVHMAATNDDGNYLEMDGIESLGGIQAGFRPMEMLLAAIGGCAAIDVVMIVDGDRISVEGAQHSQFKTIHLHFELSGEALDDNKVKRAIDLSIEKYCSVAKALEHDSQITTSYTINP